MIILKSTSKHFKVNLYWFNDGGCYCWPISENHSYADIMASMIPWLTGKHACSKLKWWWPSFSFGVRGSCIGAVWFSIFRKSGGQQPACPWQYRLNTVNRCRNTWPTLLASCYPVGFQLWTHTQLNTIICKEHLVCSSGFFLYVFNALRE